MQIPGQVLFGVATQLALLFLAGTTVVLTVQQTISVPQAIALIVVIVRYLEAFTVLAELSPGIETTTGSLRRIREVLDAPTVGSGDERAQGPTLSGDGAPRIELRELRFGYGDGAPVLDGFDLTIEAGSTTAIVGPSGSGKSSVLALIAGLHQPRSGSVTIGGHDLGALDAESRRELVSMVFQHPYLFDGSFADNVRVGDPSASDRELDEVALLARIDALVREHPEGWAGRIGEAGKTLSGGERQRVSIARALAKPAPVLLVDEATSALDTETETAVMEAVSRLGRELTILIIAHRISTLEGCDVVVQLESGRTGKVEKGEKRKSSAG